MDLKTISLDKSEARQAFLEYRAAVRERHNAEDEAIMRGYRALARGHQLLNLREAIQAGGADEHGLPKLAVMRADRRWCYVERSSTGHVTFKPEQWSHANRSRDIYRFPASTLPEAEHPRWTPATAGIWNNGRRAIVPTIPPALRPVHGLHNYEILWEATWERTPRPPGDPALLKRITGELYAVLAIWDLTPLEQAVLGARALGS